MYKESFDFWEDIPYEKRVYMRHNGKHFNKKLCQFAVSMMRVMNPATGKKERLEPLSREQVEELLQKHGVKLENNRGYDHVYACNMGKADYFKSSVPDEQHLAMFVKDYIDDPDAYEGLTFTRWCADMQGSGTAVDWEDNL